MTYDATRDIGKLKENLRTLINKELREFKAATGLEPSSVTIRFIDSSPLGSATRSWEAVDVGIDFRC